jgi:hypothetical protein
MEIKIDKVKHEAIALNEKITKCYGENVEELGREQKGLIRKAVEVTFGIIILNNENKHEDELFPAK